MATYVLIHGAGSDSWYWHRVAPLLRAFGHDVVAPDLPADDDSAGLAEYADTVIDAIGDREDVVVVAQSLAGFSAPLVCDRLPVRLLVLVAAMVPLPGEAPGDWWANTGWEQARRDQEARGGIAAAEGDPRAIFGHDLPPDVVAEAMEHGRNQSGTPFEKPWPLPAWPDVATRFLLCRDDRFFPAPFMRRLAKERLGITADEMDGGHLPALGRPEALADRLGGIPHRDLTTKGRSASGSTGGAVRRCLVRAALPWSASVSEERAVTWPVVLRRDGARRRVRLTGEARVRRACSASVCTAPCRTTAPWPV